MQPISTYVLFTNLTNVDDQYFKLDASMIVYNAFHNNGKNVCGHAP